MELPLLVARFQVALAVIPALRAAGRTVAVGFGFVAGARLLAPGALNQHAAALAVGDQPGFAGRLEWLLAALGFADLTLGRGLRLSGHRPVEIGASQRGDLFTELVAQHARLDLLHLTFGKFGKLERTV